MNPFPSKVTWRHRFASFLGSFYLTLVGRTSFVIRCDDPLSLEYRRKKKAAIYAFWHNNQVFLAYDHRGEKINVMVSQSKDGEYIAQVMRRMGLKAVRGSSTRGGEQALREICDLIEKGEQAGFTPDGPRGPVQAVHGGVITSAKLSGAPIIPTAVSARYKFTFNSWDRFFVPTPFNTITVAHGRPFHLSDEIDSNEAREKVRRSLNDAAEMARKKVEESPSWFGSFLGWVCHFFYSVSAVLAFPFVGPFLIIKYGTSRSLRHLKERFTTPQLHRNRPSLLWIHAASVGEWQALKPVLSRFKNQASCSFLVTTSTPEARRIIAEADPDLSVRLCPLDISFLIRRWLSVVRPQALIIVETEIWPQIISQCFHKNIPVFIINGRISSGALKRWKRFGPYGKRLMSYVSKVFARTDLDRTRYAELGVSFDRIEVFGNTKYDNLELSGCVSKESLRKKIFDDPAGYLIIGGSTWPGEEKLLLKLIDPKSKNHVRLILAPRRVERCSDIMTLLHSEKISFSLLSEVKRSSVWKSDVLIVDTLGDLKQLYGTADVTFIGGSLQPKGGQNPIEAASLGVPLIFGPSMENFHEEAEGLVQCGAAVQPPDGDQIIEEIKRLMENPGDQRKMGEAAMKYVASKRGSSRLTAQSIKESLSL